MNAIYASMTNVINIINYFITNYPNCFTPDKARCPKISKKKFIESIQYLCKVLCADKYTSEIIISEIELKNLEFKKILNSDDIEQLSKYCIKQYINADKDKRKSLIDKCDHGRVLDCEGKSSGFYLGLSKLYPNTLKIYIETQYKQKKNKKLFWWVIEIIQKNSKDFISEQKISKQIGKATSKKPIKERRASPPKKKKISPEMRERVWIHYVGDKIKNVKCFCCHKKRITPFTYHDTFQAGHIISEYNGGSISIDNLLPICRDCNMTMGTENWDDYVRRNGFHLRIYGKNPPPKLSGSLQEKKYTMCLSCRKYKMDKVPGVIIRKDTSRCSICMNRIRYKFDFCDYCWDNKLDFGRGKIVEGSCASCKTRLT